MKAFLLLFVSISSFAAGQDYVYSAKLGNNDKLAANCPSLSQIVVRDSGSDSAISVRIDGVKQVMKTTGESKSCLSDIVCPTSVSFGTDKHYSKIVLTRNNDGNYPTTNLEGFSDLTLDLSETPRFGSYYCYYALSAAY
jgi:hypothetical protein